MAEYSTLPPWNMDQQIAREIHFAMEHLGAPSRLLKWVDHWSQDGDARSLVGALQVFNDGRSRSLDLEYPRAALGREIYSTFELLGASPLLLGLIGSWSEGDDDDMVLDGLRAINRKGSVFEGGILAVDE
ncbi:hypothetical protein M1D80_09535 [Phyllobacteriaceae bacterium JZ32]